METLVLVMMAALAAYTLKARDQARRIALLGRHLGQHQIEKLMETLTEGYLRALGETDPQRREPIWNLLLASETALSAEFARFVADFARVDEAAARVSTLPVALPYAARLFPKASFDLRKLLAVHAHGIDKAVRNVLNQTPKDKAFTLSAELFLMQHSCHWFCRSRAVASARMLARHQTSHAKLLASVAPETRQAYRGVTGL